MGVFYNEWHLPTLWRNLNYIKLEGVRMGELIKKYKARQMYTGSKRSYLKIALSPNCFIKSQIFFHINKYYKATSILQDSLAVSIRGNSVKL